jgi:hypothetical protein
MQKLEHLIGQGCNLLREGLRSGYYAARNTTTGTFIALAVVSAGGAAVVGGLEGCTTTITEQVYDNGPVEVSHIPSGGKSLKLSENPETAKKQKERIGRQLSERLHDEFDKVGYSFMDIKEGGVTYHDVILTGYMENKDGYWATWSINLDKMCRSYMREKKFLGIIDVSDKIVVEDSVGYVVRSPNFKHDTAVQMNQIFNVYIQNNGDACLDWKNFVQEYMGPTGPGK